MVENVALGGGKRKQIRKYLGAALPGEKKLRYLTIDLENEIEKERKKVNGTYYLTKEEIGEVDEVNKKFWERYSKQNPEVQKQFDENFVNTFVYNTNSIEGSTLTPKEIDLLLNENISPNKPIDDVLEARAAQKTINFIKQNQEELSEKLLLLLHEMYFKETKPFIAGKYKTRQNRITGSNFETTQPAFVPIEMKEYFKDYNKFKKEMHPLELASWAHWKLVRIHPFQDGNGRMSRIIMNQILHKNNYAMIDIKTKEKQQYFKTLEKCNYNNNPKNLAIRLIRRFKKQYQNALK